MQRRIARDPECPHLSREGEDALEKLSFGSDNPRPEGCDLLFIFGTANSLDKLVEVAEPHLRVPTARTLLVSGGIPKFSDYQHRTEPESREIIRLLRLDRFSSLDIIEESRATNLRENVEFSRALLGESLPRSILSIMKSHSIGRTDATLRFFFPSTELFYAPYDTDFGFGLLGRDRWRANPKHRARVWGEFLRIKEYSAKGDIVLSPDQKRLVSIVEGNYAK